MTRLVLHAGTSETDWVVIQRQLASWRTPLREAGVRLHPDVEPASWATAVGDMAQGRPPEALLETSRAAVRDGADVLLLSSERLEDALRSDTGMARLLSFADQLGVPMTVVCVVRDQLGRLNSLYCHRVMQLQTAKDFSTFVSEVQPERYDYGGALAAAFATSSVELVAIPYDDLVDGRQAEAVLTAAGVPSATLAALPDGERREPLPGPVQVAATRLLFKRMWRLALFKSLARPLLLEAARRLARHGREEGWDTDLYWGWSQRAEQEAVERFQPGNEILAQAVWGRPWGHRWTSGHFLDVDIPECPPALVVDLLQTVDSVLQDLVRAKAAASAES